MLRTQRTPASIPASLNTRIHRTEIPSPLKRVKDLDKHPIGSQFRLSMQVEIDNCLSMDCFERTDVTVVRC